jgi:hypothetical protein
VIHIYNSSSSRGGSRRILSSRPTQAEMERSCLKIRIKIAHPWWFTPVIPATPKAEIRAPGSIPSTANKQNKQEQNTVMAEGQLLSISHFDKMRSFNL